jgi:toxin ParE1/3/4
VGIDLAIDWTEPALVGLTETIAYIARDDRRAAEQLRDQILAATERAAAFPHSGRMVPELARPDVREVIVRHYRIVYRVSETHVVIWAVHPGRMPLTEDVVADQPE